MFTLKPLLTTFLLLLWLGLPAGLSAQPAPPLEEYASKRGGFRLTYPGTWQQQAGEGSGTTTFLAGETRRAAPAATLTVQPRADAATSGAAALRGQDSLWRNVRRLARAHVVHIEQRSHDGYDEVRYEYTYAPSASAPARTHVLGRWVWRGNAELQLEYRGAMRQDGRYLAEGRRLVESLAFTERAARAAPVRPTQLQCDDKMYGIAAMRRYRGHWEDDCRTIHEFSTNDPTDPPVVHRRVLPFQSYALAKGFDNCLYSVTKAPTDTPEYVFRYNPATRRGGYTTWRLPAQGPGNSWISASTDEQGFLYFLTFDATRLVKVNPADGTVTPLWAADPTRTAPYYPAIAFEGAGTHGNFCLDDANTLYMVYSTDGALLRVDLRTGRPSPDLMPLDGLPQRGGYSDVLLQNDQAGRRRLYLAGPRGIYKVNVARHRARLLRKGTYTDLAGCNLFPAVPVAVASTAPAAAAPSAAAWRGRVLDSGTYQPLPKAQLRLGPAGAEASVPLTAQGTFEHPLTAGQTLAYHAQFPGYLPTDSTCAAGPGAVVRDILLRPLIVGALLRLDNVQFAQGKAVLLPNSFADLNQLVGLMASNPRMAIELRGHTDNVGAAAKNVALSEQRVGTVKAYLVARGIAAGRIAGVGLGGAQPLASNELEATRKLNRRVEVRVTAVW